MKRAISRLLSPFLRAVQEIPWFGPVISGVIVALLVNTLSTTLTELFGLWGAWIVMIVIGVLLVVFVASYQTGVTQRRKMIPPEIPAPKKYRGLIFIFSGSEPVLRAAIDYHRPILERCWLITTPEMNDKAKDAEAKFTVPGLSVDIWPVLSGASYNIRGCYEAVCTIHGQAGVPNDQMIPSDQIIADMTGGTKPMSAGMILACYDHGYRLQHVAAQFDKSGKDPAPARPIEIQLRERDS